MRERNIAVSIILTIVTCGIYGIYWFVVLTDEAKIASKDETALSGGITLLLNIITCGIYGFYWAYKMGKTLMSAKEANGMTAEDNSVLYIILQIFGLSIVSWALMQSDLNAIYAKEAGVKQA